MRASSFRSRAGLVRAKLGRPGGIAIGRPANETTLSAVHRSALGQKALLAGSHRTLALCDVSSRAENNLES
jgi:DNA-binding IscR family transcriptional regulator